MPLPLGIIGASGETGVSVTAWLAPTVSRYSAVMARGENLWVNSGNATASDDTYAALSVYTWNATSLAVGGFDLSGYSSSATLVGIEARIHCYAAVQDANWADYGVGTGITDGTAGTLVGSVTLDPFIVVTAGAAESTVTIGGETDLFGTTGLELGYFSTSTNMLLFCPTQKQSGTDIFVDYIEARFYYQ